MKALHLGLPVARLAVCSHGVTIDAGDADTRKVFSKSGHDAIFLGTRIGV